MDIDELWKSIEEQGFVYTRQAAIIAAHEHGVPEGTAHHAVAQAVHRGGLASKKAMGTNLLHIPVEAFREWLERYTPVKREIDGESENTDG